MKAIWNDQVIAESNDTLVIEGVPAVQFKGLTTRLDKLLTWGGGAAFTVFAQSANRQAIRLVGYLLCATILKTAVSPPPKQWPIISRRRRKSDK